MNVEVESVDGTNRNDCLGRFHKPSNLTQSETGRHGHNNQNHLYFLPTRILMWIFHDSFTIAMGILLEIRGMGERKIEINFGTRTNPKGMYVNSLCMCVFRNYGSSH